MSISQRLKGGDRLGSVPERIELESETREQRLNVRHVQPIVGPEQLWNLVFLVGFFAVCMWIAMRQMERKLIK